MIHKRNNTRTCLAFIITCSLFLCACNKRQLTKDEQLILRAEQIVDQHPDSSLTLLQSVENPEKLPEKEYADYLLLQVQAHTKTGINIKDDTLIYTSAAYFSQTDDFLKAAKANVYAARVLLAQGNNEKAMVYLLPAKDFATAAGDAKLLGFIHYSMGNAYSSNGNYDKALASFRKAREYYMQAGNQERGIWMLDYIGNMVWQLEEPDSALHCFRQVLEYAEKTNNKWYISRSNRRISGVYWDLKQLDKCKHHALLSISMDKGGDDAIFNYPTLSRCYLQEGKLDSALLYTEKMREIKTFHMPESMLIYQNLIFQIQEKRGNLPSALVAAKEIMQLQSTLTDAHRKSAISYIFEQHEKERVENNYNRVVIHRLRLVIAFIATILLGVLVGWYLMYRIKRRENELLEAKQALQIFQEMLSLRGNQLKKSNQSLAEKEEQLHTYDQLFVKQTEQLQDYDQILSERNKKSEQLRDILMDKLDIARKIAQMNVVATDNTKEYMEQFQKIFGENLLDWESIYPVINNLYDGFADRIKNMYPKLLTKDIQLCCFIRAGFKTEEIAIVLNYTQSTVRVKKTRLSRKMGFNEYNLFLEHINSL